MAFFHSETNRSDSLSNKQLNELLPLVREGRWRLQDIAKRPEQYYYEDTETSEESFETPLPLSSVLCEYLREELNKLANGNQINQNDQLEALTTKTPPLTKNEIRESIASVIRAVNQRHPPGAGFTTESSKTELESSITKNGDLISVYMLEATENAQPLHPDTELRTQQEYRHRHRLRTLANKQSHQSQDI
ncbi:hypothetical protein J3E74DRAFT_413784 [Bipolaris maydis]|nr:hypothetical protein J3E74DRAFT_413784 [Bipolaris maydis]